MNARTSFLEPASYREAFQNAQSAMHKSLLIIVGLVAFWLAIENTYARYVDIFDRTVDLDADRSLSIQIRLRDLAQRPYDRAALPDPKDSNSELGERSKQLGQERETLRKESVDLSIAGTKLPSPLSIAPSMWLAVLVCWLFYFNARRASAYRNLAAFYLSAHDQRRFGAAGEGSMWLAPMPHSVLLNSEQETPVSHAELLALAGWTDRTERNYRLALAFFFLFLIFMIYRVFVASLDLTSEFALQEKLVQKAWRLPGTLLPVLLSVICLYLTYRLVTKPSASFVEDTPILSKRMFLGGAVTLGLGGAVWFYRDLLLQRANKYRFARTDPAVRSTQIRQINPRFVRPEKKARRLRNRRNEPVLSFRDVLLVNTRTWLKDKRRSAAVHYAASDGKVLIFSKPGKLTHLSPLNLADAVANARADRKSYAAGSTSKAQDSPLPVSTARMVAWETATLACLEAKPPQIDRAFEILLTAARITIPTIGDRPANLRIVDLLAGLAVHQNRPEHLATLIALVEQRSTALRPRLARSRRKAAKLGEAKAAARPNEVQHSIPNPLLARLRKWKQQTSSWRSKWETRFHWHHPTDTTDPPEPMKVSDRRPPKTRGKGQRPIAFT